VTQTQNQEQGALRADQNELIGKGFSFSGYERDGLFMNLGGKKFMDISGVSGIDSITDGRGAVFADFDNDGDYDVFLTTIQGESHLLFRNNVGQDNNWLRVSLEGEKDVGRDAFSSVVRVKTSAGTLTKIKSGGSGFISQHDPRLLFGLGKDQRAQSIEVTWPNGKVEKFEGEARANSSLLLREGTGKIQLLNLKSAKLPDPLTRDETLAAGLKIALRRELPDLKFTTISGSASSLREQLKPGRRVLINIWATWCIPCAREMPELETLRAKLSEHGVDLIGLNVDTETDAPVKSFINEKGVKYPIFIGGIPVIEQLYATDDLRVPISIVVNDRGIVTDIISGWSVETERKFRALVGEATKLPAQNKARP